MKRIFFLFWMTFVFVSCGQKPAEQTSSEPGKRPNIIFIIGDDVGCYDLGCYGNEGIQTPNIDRLSAEGLHFDNAFLTISSCSPSRVSIITGRYPHNTGACELHSPLPPDQVLFPEILKAHGYYTAQAGKWHFGSTAYGNPEKIHKGDYKALGPAVRAFDRFSVLKEDNGDGGEAMWLRILRERPKDKPFFFWFASSDSHRPWGADTFQVQNQPGNVWVPPFLYDGPLTRRDLTSYYNEISRLDFYVGQVEKELQRQGIADNTILIFTSDNGRPFPRCKTRVYDSGLKTPLLIKWPGHIKPGQKTEALISIIDLAPTLLQLAGIQPGPAFQGKSFATLFDHPEKEFRHYIFSEHNWHDYEAYERQVRTKKYMYILNKRPQFDSWGPADAVSSPSMKEIYATYRQHKTNCCQEDIFVKPRPVEEFFEVVKDPMQFFNLAEKPEFQKQKNALKKVLAQWQRETGDTEPKHLTPDNFDRKTGKRMFEGFHRGEMPGKAKDADTITQPGPF